MTIFSDSPQTPPTPARASCAKPEVNARLHEYRASVCDRAVAYSNAYPSYGVSSPLANNRPSAHCIRAKWEEAARQSQACRKPDPAREYAPSRRTPSQGVFGPMRTPACFDRPEVEYDEESDEEGCAPTGVVDWDCPGSRMDVDVGPSRPTSYRGESPAISIISLDSSVASSCSSSAPNHLDQYPRLEPPPGQPDHESDSERPKKTAYSETQRRMYMEEDRYCEDVGETSVVCRGCMKRVALDGRFRFYPGLWHKHRARCIEVQMMAMGLNPRLAQGRADAIAIIRERNGGKGSRSRSPKASALKSKAARKSPIRKAKEGSLQAKDGPSQVPAPPPPCPQSPIVQDGLNPPVATAESIIRREWDAIAEAARQKTLQSSSTRKILPRPSPDPGPARRRQACPLSMILC
ncbi:hypothetical protein MKEN_01109000 [Mycena kentingensis (nom. inval.)]|nr:hypothetical protein MKEN_01109000 [Mycena kentingensis (nom. inval.)]